MRFRKVVTLLLLFAGAGIEAGGYYGGAGGVVGGHSPAPALQDLLQELARSSWSHGGGVELAPRLLPYGGRGAAGQWDKFKVTQLCHALGGGLPVIVLPVPVYLSDTSRGCDARPALSYKQEDGTHGHDAALAPSPAVPRPHASAPAAPDLPSPSPSPKAPHPPAASHPSAPRRKYLPTATTPRPRPTNRPVQPKMDRVVSSQEIIEQYKKQVPEAPYLPPAVLGPSPSPSPSARADDPSAPELPASGSSGHRGFSHFDSTQRGFSNGSPPQSGVSQAESLPLYDYPDQSSSQEGSSNGYLPPLPRRYLPSPPEINAGIEGYHYPSPRGQTPTPPVFASSLILEAELTVPRSDYTEPYVMWYDGTTGESRTEFHGGTAVSVTSQLPDGQYQMFEMHVDDTEAEGGVNDCGVSAPTSLASPPPPPGLPDLQKFEFSGYTQIEGSGRAEVWRREVRGGEGEHSAVQGEELTHTHTLTLTRDHHDYATPISYKVQVQSSVVGEAGGWEHRYRSVKHHQPDRHLLHFDIRACDKKQRLDMSRGSERARLQPLYEFTHPVTDERYNEEFEKFQKEFEREYVDDKEAAVRKHLLIQTSRFVASANREGAPFETGVNFLADRLDAELAALRGVRAAEGAAHYERFPLSARAAAMQARALPDRFDWRDRGGVSAVRYQGSCSSCWAVSVAGAVEGALFRVTNTLTPLAEQALVDCAHKTGAHGCNGTWPNLAYDYVQQFGLPALSEYGPHKKKVEQCRDDVTRPVTRISAHVNVTRRSIDALKVAIHEHAPTVVVLDAKAKSFIFYKKGVLKDDRCQKNPRRLNHAVLATGWGVERSLYFAMKNSWSAAWGEGGYIRLQADNNVCGHLELASYPRLEPSDRDPPSPHSDQHDRSDTDLHDDDDDEGYYYDKQKPYYY